jgi:hypothetical protein
MIKYIPRLGMRLCRNCPVFFLRFHDACVKRGRGGTRTAGVVNSVTVKFCRLARLCWPPLGPADAARNAENGQLGHWVMAWR